MWKMRFNQLGRKPDSSSSSSCRFGANATRVEMLVTLSNPCTWDSIGSVLRIRRNCATYAASTPGGNVNEKIAEIQIASGSSCFCSIGINTKKWSGMKLDLSKTLLVWQKKQARHWYCGAGVDFPPVLSDRERPQQNKTTARLTYLRFRM